LTAVRDFIDVRDAADAVVAAAFIAEPADRLINCGSGSPTRSRDLVSALARIARYDGDIREERSGSARSPGVAWQTADIRRSTRVLGWSTKRTVDDALQALWDGPG
jgi:nucleoside-diphosphate-sugar epimerase